MAVFATVHLPSAGQCWHGVLAVATFGARDAVPNPLCAALSPTFDVDEYHHVPAPGFVRVSDRVKTR